MTMPPEDVETVEPTTATPAPTTVRTFTAEEVEKFRADERSKIQGKMDKLKAQFDEQSTKFNELAEAQTARERAEAEEAEARAAQLRDAEEADLDAKQLLEKRTAEFTDKFAKLEQEQHEREHLLNLERQYLEMKAYIQGRVAEETAKHTVHPTFFDYIDGNTVEEVEASIALAVQKTEAMAQEIQEREQGQQQQAFQTGSGVSTNTGPSSFGTVLEGNEELDIENLTYPEFVKNRTKLIKTATNDGIFGGMHQ
jgi:hypothetical protein